MIERLWRTLKYEEVYLKEFGHYIAPRESLSEYFVFYNEERRHSSLGRRTPAESIGKVESGL
jgi:putative transposase